MKKPTKTKLARNLKRRTEPEPIQREFMGSLGDVQFCVDVYSDGTMVVEAMGPRDEVRDVAATVRKRAWKLSPEVRS